MCGCLGKLGSVAADIISPIIFRATGSLAWTFWISVFLNILAFGVVIILNIIDNINEKRRIKLRFVRKQTEVKNKII
jgi:nitrate/nitrite transporter NarK